MGALIFLHVLGAVLFLGNIITAAFWKLSAERGQDLAHLRRVARNVMHADYWFTLPGVILLLATGHIMAALNGYSLAELNWMTASEALFVLSGLIWGILLIPAQRTMMKQSVIAEAEGALTAAYRKASRTWDVFGTLVILIPLFVLYLMLVKPF
ncbi:DUF2269 family protein [Paenibacillus tyrfis]|uniref:Membrane protein n=1 Tax=Paenibacillus tyrfis TaxID=1501230 RepID=A0A081NXK9_9BACL|nr:DUF2269 family protein [Paenibacillus tyrfis]KEQ23182.1 membrane protein [Paenibacillus tyrfis]